MRDVVVIGGGPVGIFLAAILAQRGVDVSVWERRSSGPELSRAIGVHPPSLAAFDALGIADDVIETAVRIRRGVARSGGRTLGSLTFDRLPGRFPFIASLPQFQTERIVADRLRELAPEAVRRGIGLVGLDDVDPEKVRLHGRSAEGDVFEVARFVVGADGARSAVRHLLGIAAPLKPYPDSFVMGDFDDETTDGDDAVVYLEREGVVESFPLPGSVRRFVVHTGVALVRPTAQTVADLLRARVGADVDASTNTMLSVFTPRLRLAARLVRGRVSLIGDAAHEISPIGGQGMNLGWLDAVALAPILAAALGRDRLDPGALDAFETERLRAAKAAARQAEANMTLGRPMRRAPRAAQNVALGLALATPAGRVLARRYSMT